MPTGFIDAHNHLQDSRLFSVRGEFPVLPASVVNGTRENDWAAVAELARVNASVIPSFGLHPWHVNARSAAWKTALTARLDADACAAIGEIGLDRWIAGHDLPAQIECLRFQLSLAAERHIPVTLHCIRAWGALDEVLQNTPRPGAFLIHAYAGPAEMVPGFVKMGASFSFSPSFLDERKASQRQTFREIPDDRLLVETDAPDLPPPPDQNPHPLSTPDGSPINHPANIETAYRALARLRGMSLDSLVARVAENFARVFPR